MPEAHRKPVSYVRRSGRMTPAQQRAWQQLAPRYLLDLPRDEAAMSVAADARIDSHAAFDRAAPLIVEVGSGQGHSIVHAATKNPEQNFLAIEVFRAGLARTMIRAAWAKLSNLRLVEADIITVLSHALPAASIHELWVFFPDPWQKKRHHKRRLIDAQFTALAARALDTDGVLRLATDCEDYAEQMRSVLDADPHFARAFTGEWAQRFHGRTQTAFERKGMQQGRTIRDLSYLRTAPPRD